MKKSNFLATFLPAALLGLLSSGAAVAASINYTFDADNQGWTRGSFASTLAGIELDYGGAIWNAAGYLAGIDHGPYAFHFSPNLGGGYGDLFGESLSLDFRTSVGGGDDPFVVLMSSTGFLVKTQNHAASTTDFTSFSYALDSSAGWYFNSSPYYDSSSAVLATDAQIQDVLNDLRYVGVSTDIGSGNDDTWLDNVSAVPEPSGFMLLGITGSLALVRRRRGR